jgi:hypothetical protein
VLKRPTTDIEAFWLHVAVIWPVVATLSSTEYTPAAVVAGNDTNVVLPSCTKHVASVLLATLTTTRCRYAPGLPKVVVEVAPTAT